MSNKAADRHKDGPPHEPASSASKGNSVVWATAYDRLLDALADAGCDVSSQGNRSAQAQCPAHDDDNPSLSVTGIEGSVLLCCHAGCETAEVLTELGLELRDLYDSEKGATYTYPDRTVTRSPDKKFRQYGAPKGQPTQLFRLPRVLDAVEVGLPVFVVEGEKDVLALESLGAVATTAPMGSSNWRKVDASPLYCADVVAVVDQDAAGERWAEQVRDSLEGKAASLRFCRAAVGKDAADHVAAGYGPGDFLDLKVESSRLDVSNPAEAADWLRQEVGQQGTPLAGLFRRGGGIVHTPRIGEEGYVPLVDEDEWPGRDDGPAQVREVDAARLRSWVQFSYQVEKWQETQSQWVSAVFPADAAALVVNAVELAPALRPLAGVTHTPTLRADGTVLSAEGYDSASALLYLPERGLTVVRVPDEPSVLETETARDLISEMLAGFDFNTEHDRAHYLALLFTPLLRVMVPPPYPLGLIHAHQPGSGKSLLAWILRTLHGGALRPLPENQAEFRKQITSILSVTTAPVVQFDNVHKLDSATLDAVLTTDVWSDRPLGATADVTARNDRLWIATGNNVTIGGDLLRRVRWTSIDPNVPHPEQRTDFAIPDLKAWVRKRKGELLGALLTLLRAWVLAGKPLGPEVGSDDYAFWTQNVQGVLGVAGWSGIIGHPDTLQQEGTDEDTEWGAFLGELRRLFGDAKWTARDLVGRLDLDPEAVPADMNTGSARAVGMWLRNRQGRWAGGFCLRSAGGRDANVWQVQPVVR